MNAPRKEIAGGTLSAVTTIMRYAISQKTAFPFRTTDFTENSSVDPYYRLTLYSSMNILV